MTIKVFGFSAFGLGNLGFDSGSVSRQKGYSIVPVKGRLGDSYTYIGGSKNQKSVLLGSYNQDYSSLDPNVQKHASFT